MTAKKHFDYFGFGVGYGSDMIGLLPDTMFRSAGVVVQQSMEMDNYETRDSKNISMRCFPIRLLGFNVRRHRESSWNLFKRGS